MSKIKFAVNGLAWGRENVERFLADAATAEYCGVEIDGEVAAYHYDRTHQFRLLLAEHEVGLASLTGRFDLDDPDKRDDEVSYNKMVAEFARMCGARLLVLTFGGCGGGDDALDRAAEACAVLGEYCAMLGVRPCIRPQAGGLFASPDAVDRLLEKTQSLNLRLCLDAGWALAVGGDPAELARRWRDRIAHVVFSDFAPGDDSRAVVPGAGGVDFAALLGALCEFGYEGWAVIDPGADCAEPTQFIASAKDFVAVNLHLSPTFENVCAEGQTRFSTGGWDERIAPKPSAPAEDVATPEPAAEPQPEPLSEEGHGEPEDAPPVEATQSGEVAGSQESLPEVPAEARVEELPAGEDRRDEPALQAAPEADRLPPGEPEAPAEPTPDPPKADNNVFGAGIFSDEE